MLKIYSVRDTKVGAYQLPQISRSHGEAERNFKTLSNQEKTPFYMYPEDFDLFYIGDFDEQTGKIVSLDTPQHIIKAIQLKEIKPLV